MTNEALGEDDEDQRRLARYYPLAEMADREFALGLCAIVADRVRDLVLASVSALKAHRPRVAGLDSDLLAAETLGLIPGEYLADLRAVAKIAALGTEARRLSLEHRRYARHIEALHVLTTLDGLTAEPRSDVTVEVLRLNLGTGRDRLRMAVRMLDHWLAENTAAARQTAFARFSPKAVPAGPLSEVEARYREALGLFENRVQAAIDLSRAAGNRQSETSAIAWASVLFTRLVNFAVSLSKLLPGSAYASSNATWDNSAVSALARSAYECFLLLFYIGLDEVEEVEWIARQKLMYLHDCTMRLRVFYAEDDGGEQRAFYEDERATLVEQLSANAYFAGLGDRRRAHLLRGRDLFFHSQDEILARLGLDAANYRRLYELLSAHVHSLPVSFYRAFEDGRGRGVENDAELGYIAQGIDFVGGLLGAGGAGYRDLFPDLRAAATEGN